MDRPDGMPDFSKPGSDQLRNIEEMSELDRIRRLERHDTEARRDIADLRVDVIRYRERCDKRHEEFTSEMKSIARIVYIGVGIGIALQTLGLAMLARILGGAP